MPSKAQQSALDNVLVAPENQRVIGKCNMRINPYNKIPGQEFDEPPTEEEALCFIRELGHSEEIKYITDGMYYKKNLDFVALIWEDLAYQIDNIDSKKQDKIHEDAQIYGAILPKAMTNQAMLDSVAYKTYYEIASGAEPPKSKKPKTKSDLAISSEETPSKKKPIKAKK
ncbi:hypothetical protein Tco_1127119 [Tanacetum coccineum]